MTTYTITFNTGRLYTSEGQIVTASYDTDTNICEFADHSRMIQGRFVTSLPALPVDELGQRLLARRVMSAYDAHRYDMVMTNLTPRQRVIPLRL